MLRKQDFDIENLDDILCDGISNVNDIRTFINLLRDTAQNSHRAKENHNNLLVNNLLHISKLIAWPFNVK